MNYSDSSNPITLKSEFILSLCEILLGTLNPIQKSIVDRCTSSVYRNYLQSNYKTTPPTIAKAITTIPIKLPNMIFFLFFFSILYLLSFF